MALRRAGVVNEIVGAGRNEVNLKKAIELDVIDRYSLNFAEEVSGSDVVVVATPVLAMNSIFELIATTDYRDTIITDVGSVKKQILQFAEMHLDSSYNRFVPAHPIAGREHSGVEAARVDLFERKRTLVTPTENTNSDAVETVKNMWLAAGSVVGSMDVAFHDTILSACSHLPHLAAFGLVHYIHDHEYRQECFDLAASGFYDFTRIASSDPVMWSDICSANAAPICRNSMVTLPNFRRSQILCQPGKLMTFRRFSKMRSLLAITIFRDSSLTDTFSGKNFDNFHSKSKWAADR